MESIGIIGAGTMGTGIAEVALISGFSVTITDVSPDALSRAGERIAASLQKRAQKGEFPAAKADAATAQLRTSATLDALADAGFVIEAAIEQFEAKQEILKRAALICQSDTILATNTSSLSVTRLAAGLPVPGNMVGMHFFNPAARMKLVEIVRGFATTDAVIERTFAMAKAMGKTAILVKDSPGFIVNRVARPFYGEALRLLAEGVAEAEEIDRIVKLEGGFKMGPFELMDLIGIDINLAVTESIYEQTFHEPRYRPHQIQKTMVDAGLLGRKTGRGFYRYDP